MINKVYLIGNPNVGKSVVFSRLTGVHVVSSNYPGTTVEILKGDLLLEGNKVDVIDLPGVYSLEPSSSSDEITTSLLRKHPKDEFTVINILDATNLERNLLLTLQLLEEGFPVIVCLNMCDEAQHKGIQIDAVKLADLLGVLVVPTCAVTGVGIKELIAQIPAVRPAHRARFSQQERWGEIGRIVEGVQRLAHKHHNIREILEDASVRPFTGILMAAGVLFAAFKVVRFIGETIIARVTDPFFFNVYQPLLERMIPRWQEKDFLVHLLVGDPVNGQIDLKQSLGVLTTAPYIEFGMVLPYVISFYFILSLLEDVGYLPRLAILLDNLLHRLGLHGFAIIPVLLGFGCNVPGILSTRVLESKRERFIAATIISIGVPCVPLQAMIFGLLGQHGGFYVGGVYLTLLALIVMVGFVLNRLMPGHSPEFLIEIPPYRFPPMGMLAKKLFFRVKGFIVEALPVVFIGIAVVNTLLYFHLFDILNGIFAPIVNGLFGLPKESAIALVIGFLRKDVAVGMLMPLGLSVKQLFIATTLLAISFPCVATFFILWKELGLKGLLKSTLLMVGISIVVGTVLNLLVH